MIPGAFTPFRLLNWMDQRIFEEAFSGMVGVEYTPYAVSTQVVNGVKYQFLCTKVVVTENPISSIAIVVIHRSLDKVITRLDDIEFIVKE